MILVLFHQVDALGNWSLAEVGVLYGLLCVSFALADLVFGHLDQLPEMIRMLTGNSSIKFVADDDRFAVISDAATTDRPLSDVQIGAAFDSHCLAAVRRNCRQRRHRAHSRV